MRRTSRGTFPALITLCAFSAFGCGPGFEPVARLTRLRVLAIGNEPVNPIPGEVTTFEALVYAPPAIADQPFTYSWSWCPVLGQANDGYACPITDGHFQQMGANLGLVDLPPLKLGTDRTQPFTNPFPSALLADLCKRGFEGTLPDCEGGFPVRVNFTVVQAGPEHAATTILRLPIADGVPSNANPRFDPSGPALGALIGGVEQPINSQAALTLPRWKETDLRAHVADVEAESYMGTDDNDQPAVLRERLVLSWFVETGDVAADSHNTGYFPGQTEIEQFLSNKWKPSTTATYPNDQAQLIVVLRDNRGGVSWTSASVRLEPTP